MSISCKALILFGSLFFSLTGQAQSVNVNSVHYWTAPKRARMMIDMSSQPAHRVELLDQPPRLVIHIRNAQLDHALGQPPAEHALFSRLRTIQKGEDVRIVVDLKKQVSQNSFTLNPNKMYGHRLVVDLVDASSGGFADSRETEAADSVNAKSPAIKPVRLKKSVNKDITDASKNILPVSGKGKDVIVAIDAGHGGDDPGAHGSNGTEEKKVVYSIARKLESLINSQRGMRAVMVRKGDYYVAHRKRMEIARAARADLFVSIHADAFKKNHVKGASVFTLSSSGASSEAARWLADSENASDLVGGVSLDDKEEVLASVLLDLSQMATQEASVNVANHVLKHFHDIGELHFDSVQKAEFLVLKSPDIPSILVETGFISNPSEERKLKSSAHQSRIALAIFKGVRDYFKQYSPVDTRVAGL